MHGETKAVFMVQVMKSANDLSGAHGRAVAKLQPNNLYRTDAVERDDRDLIVSCHSKLR